MIFYLIATPTPLTKAQPSDIYVPSEGDVLIYTENSSEKEIVIQSSLMTATGEKWMDEKINMTTVYYEEGTMELKITGVNDTHFDSTDTHIQTENATGTIFEGTNSTYDPSIQKYIWDNYTEVGTPVETTEVNTSSLPYNSSYVPSGFEMGKGNFIDVGISKMPFQFGDDEEEQNGNDDNGPDLFTVMGLTDWNTSSWSSTTLQKELTINNFTFTLDVESWKLTASANANWANDTFPGMPVPVKVVFEFESSLIVDYDIATKLVIGVTSRTTMIMDMTLKGTTDLSPLGEVTFDMKQERVMNSKMETKLKSHSSFYTEAPSTTDTDTPSSTNTTTTAAPPAIIPSFTLSTVVGTVGLMTTFIILIRRQRRT